MRVQRRVHISYSTGITKTAAVQRRSVIIVFLCIFHSRAVRVYYRILVIDDIEFSSKSKTHTLTSFRLPINIYLPTHGAVKL